VPHEPDKRRAVRIVAKLREAYPDVTCALDHRDAYQLLVATILSAQCTDERVNMVTPALFERYPAPAALAGAEQSELEDMIRSTGFYRNKAKNLIGMARALVGDHGGTVPAEIGALVALPGVARKTANVVLGTAFGISSGVVVDTHVLRVAHLLGLTEENDPVKVERDLMAVLPQEDWIDFSHRLIHHGRRVCDARKPACDQCNMSRLCPSAFAEPKTKAERHSAARRKKGQQKQATKTRASRSSRHTR
jgi:endonuclease-3